MAGKSVLLLYLNLGGEMVYILAHRLQAQKIDKRKSMEMLAEIITEWLNERTLKEICHSRSIQTQLYSTSVLRQVFQKLVHSSSMRLNADSLDSLVDLMLMAVKHQVLFCPRAADLLLITLNHLDELQQIAALSGKTSDELEVSVERAYHLLLANYAKLSTGEWLRVRQSMLNFFLNIRIKVSLFVRNELQRPEDGRFVIPPSSGTLPTGVESPGIIKIISQGRVDRTVEFNSGSRYQICWKDGSIGRLGDRVTQLGKNMYVHGVQVDVAKRCEHANDASSSQHDAESRAQVDLLAALLGTPRVGRSTNCNEIVRLSLFPSQFESDSTETPDKPPQARKEETGVMNIQANRRVSNELSRIMRDLEFQ